MERIVYQCNVLQGINKIGDLKKLDNNYREVRLGSLGAHNSAGWVYDEAAGRRLIEGSAGLMRMINQNNALRGECGHPRMSPGMTQLQWFNRVADIYEPNVCFHIRRLMLDSGRDEQGRPITMILGEVRESGKESGWFERQMENRDENVAFSIRSFTNDRVVAGRKTKYLTRIVTWDTVNEPGLVRSDKYGSPSLESAGGTPLPELELETVFYGDALRKELDAQKELATGTSFENNNSVMSLIAELERPIRITVPPSWRW